MRPLRLKSFNSGYNLEADAGTVRIAKSKHHVLEKHVPYVTSVERLARREVRQEMLIRAEQRQYRASVPEELARRIRGTTDVAVLERWFDLVFEAKSFEEFQRRMQS